MNEKHIAHQNQTLNTIVGKVHKDIADNILNSSFKVSYPSYHTEERKYNKILKSIKRKYSPKQAASCIKLRIPLTAKIPPLPQQSKRLGLIEMQRELIKMSQPHLKNKAPIQALLCNKTVLQLKVKEQFFSNSKYKSNKMDINDILLNNSSFEL